MPGQGRYTWCGGWIPGRQRYRSVLQGGRVPSPGRPVAWYRQPWPEVPATKHPPRPGEPGSGGRRRAPAMASSPASLEKPEGPAPCERGTRRDGSGIAWSGSPPRAACSVAVDMSTAPWSRGPAPPATGAETSASAAPCRLARSPGGGTTSASSNGGSGVGGWHTGGTERSRPVDAERAEAVSAGDGPLQRESRQRRAPSGSHEVESGCACLPSVPQRKGGGSLSPGGPQPYS